MTIDLLRKYGPGMSFYLPQTDRRVVSNRIALEDQSPLEVGCQYSHRLATRATVASSRANTQRYQSYSTTLSALGTSNQDLQNKMSKLRSKTIRLQLDLMKLQRHISTLQHDLLPTWQADVLTILVGMLYRMRRWKVLLGFAIVELQELETTMSYEDLSKVYVAAARGIDRVSLKRTLGLSASYHGALCKYREIVEFRSVNPYQTECSFARWLMSQKEKNPNLHNFWARLFPLCYGRTTEESAEIF